MKKLILKILWSAIGKEIARVIIDYFLKKLAQRGYYMTASSADASRSGYGNILQSEQFRSAMITEFVDQDLEEIKP
jgi:hypothetical protein